MDSHEFARVLSEKLSRVSRVSIRNCLVCAHSRTSFSVEIEQIVQKASPKYTR